MSPSSRGRGLKYHNVHYCRTCLMSPSSRGRGLKCHLFRYLDGQTDVALFTRAWIEINPALPARAWRCRSPSSRGRGLKLPRKTGGKWRIVSPSSRGRGLKSNRAYRGRQSNFVALFTRAWIEIPDEDEAFNIQNGRPLHEGVD